MVLKYILVGCPCYRDWNSLRNWFSLIIVYNWLAVLKKTSEQTLLTCLVFVKYCWLSFWLFFIWTTNHLGMKGLAVLMYAIVDSKWPIAIDWITPGYIIIVFAYFIISIFFSDLFKLIGAWDCTNTTTHRVYTWIIWIPRSAVFICPFQLLIPDWMFDFQQPRVAFLFTRWKFYCFQT